MIGWDLLTPTSLIMILTRLWRWLQDPSVAADHLLLDQRRWNILMINLEAAEQEHKAIWTLEQPVSVTKAASAWTIGAVVAGLGHQLSAAESQWAGDLVTMVGQGCRSRTMHGTGQGGHHWQQTPPQDLPTTYSIGQVITFIISYQNTFYDLLSGQRYELTCEATVGGGREENFNNSFYFFIRTVMFFVKYVFFSWIKSSSP